LLSYVDEHFGSLLVYCVVHETFFLPILLLEESVLISCDFFLELGTTPSPGTVSAWLPVLLVCFLVMMWVNICYGVIILLVSLHSHCISGWLLLYVSVLEHILRVFLLFS
jgi:hypothetical protein